MIVLLVFVLQQMTYIFYSLTVTISASSGKLQGFLCQARTDINDNTTVVGALTAAGTYPMKDICGTVRHFQNCSLHENTIYFRHIIQLLEQIQMPLSNDYSIAILILDWLISAKTFARFFFSFPL